MKTFGTEFWKFSRRGSFLQQKRKKNKLLGVDFWCGVYRPGEWLWINFRRSTIIAELWRPEVARRWKKWIFVLLEKRPLTGKIFKILFRKFSSRHRSTCCAQISWNLTDEKSVSRALYTWQKNSPGCPALATARIAPKICQGQPPRMYSECSRFHPNRFTFGGVISEFWTREHCQSALDSESNIRQKPNFEPSNNVLTG